MPKIHLEQHSALDKPEQVRKYWSPGCSEDDPLQRPRTSPKDPVWSSQGRHNLTFRGRPGLTSCGRPDLTPRGHPNLASKGRPWEFDSGRPKDVLGTSHTGPSNLLDDVGSSVGFPQISLYFSFESYSIDQIYPKVIQHSRCIWNPVKLLRWSFFCEIGEWVSSVNYFREKTISQKFDWVLTTPLILSSNVNWPGR